MTVSKTSVNKHEIVSNMPLSVEVYQVSSICSFVEIHPTHDSTQPTKKLKKSRPNPCVDPTHGQLCVTDTIIPALVYESLVIKFIFKK